jgi:hypothetical protein
LVTDMPETTPSDRAASQFRVASFVAREVTLMLWTIFAILLILWLLGWGFNVAGNLIHMLLVIALVVAVINLITGRRTV